MTKTKNPTLVRLDPNELTIHPDNVRRDLQDLRALTRSITEVGVLVPLVVVPTDDGGHMVVAGHRRRAAAIAAGCEVPCVVRHDLVGQADQIAAMVVENVHREDLTSAEEAAAYEQLAILGLSDHQIAKATGVTRPHVAKARKVAASEVASEVAGRYALTLDQAVMLTEFEDDREAIKQLVVTARKDPSQFDHLASRLRHDRELAAQRAATVEGLAAAGVAILDRHDAGKARPLRDLTDGKDGGAPISPKAHAACEGRAAVVSEWNPTEVAHYCLDPARYDHRDRYGRGGRPVGTPLSDEAKAERREVVENNKAWRAAEPVRRRYVQELLARKSVPKGTLRFVTEEITAHPGRVGASDALLAELLGAEPAAGVGPAHLAKVNDARLPLALLAQVAANREQAMGVQTWRHRDGAAARWLAFLGATGYGLSDIEQHVIDAAAPSGAANVSPSSAATADEDGEPETETEEDAA